jgi:hypothetical protein
MFLEKRFPEHKFEERRVCPFSVLISVKSRQSYFNRDTDRVCFCVGTQRPLCV